MRGTDVISQESPASTGAFSLRCEQEQKEEEEARSARDELEAAASSAPRKRRRADERKSSARRELAAPHAPGRRASGVAARAPLNARCLAASRGQSSRSFVSQCRGNDDGAEEVEDQNQRSWVKGLKEGDMVISHQRTRKWQRDARPSAGIRGGAAKKPSCKFLRILLPYHIYIALPRVRLSERSSALIIPSAACGLS